MRLLLRLCLILAMAAFTLLAAGTYLYKVDRNFMKPATVGFAVTCGTEGITLIDFGFMTSILLIFLSLVLLASLTVQKIRKLRPLPPASGRSGADA